MSRIFLMGSIVLVVNYQQERSFPERRIQNGKQTNLALTEMDHAVQQIRDRNLLASLPLEASLRVLDLVDRYHATADALGQGGEILHALRIERYWGDYAL